ncbi:MAG TPA: hypothetical protein VNW15_06215 [Rhizomicrobium sp.]|nr:hypothetical protein [Rhizomicrobium sp.]
MKAQLCPEIEKLSRRFARLPFVVVVACLYGCAAKQVTPVQMTQSGDEQLDCPALKQQIAANQAAAVEFIRKDKQVENANVARGVGSAIPVFGILLAMSYDLSNEEQVKARALADRNEELTYLAKRRGCET